MSDSGAVNILLVDDQPAKLMTYEVVLEPLGENLMKASTAQEALEWLLRTDVAVILMDVSMPDIDGFALAAMIREHPRYKDTAIIFVSAVHLSDADYVRGYQMGAVDYVSAPVVAEILRAKVKIFVELHRQRRQYEALNGELEKRVAERTSDLHKANELQVILAREVDHRAKNALAVAQAIVRLTQAKTMGDYVTALEGRISALARAHTLLSESRWEGARLRKIVEDELAPYGDPGGEKISIEGPDVVLKPASAQALALALHELATNAAKYGALARKRGKLRLSWTNHGGLVLVWQESNVGNVRVPTKSGFGTKVMELSIRTQLGGDVRFDWKRDGLHCHFEVPDRADHTRQRMILGEGDGSANRRILVVEDEPLVAMMVGRLVTSLGYDVVGPCPNLATALAAINGEPFAGALLDINLDGELVYSVAEVLSERQIPFLFMTGYASERIERRFSGIPVLQKPLDASSLKQILEAQLERPV